MSAAKVDIDGTVTQLDGKGGPPEVVTEEDVQDPKKLARLLERLLRDVAQLKRRWDPKVTFFQDITVDATGTTKYPLQHDFGGRVNWYVAQWDPTVAGTEVRLDQHADTDDNTLVLVSGGAGTVTVLVQEAG